MLRLLPSTHSKSLTRPTSMQLDLEDGALLELGKVEYNANDLASTGTTLLVPNLDGNRTRSRSNQNLAKSSSLSPNFLSTAPHGGPCLASQAQSSSPLHSAPCTLNCTLSMPTSFCSSRPTFMTQISYASSSVADSPSPVERDGLMSCRSVTKSEPAANSNSLPLKGTELKSLEISGWTGLESRRNDQQHSVNHDTCSLGSTVGKSQRIVSKATHYPGSGTSQHFLLRKQQPHHSLSNPEFPLTLTRVSVNQPDRTHSYDDLYASRRKPPFHHPTNEVSPSREKINNLSSHICSSLDQNWPSSLSYESGSYQHLLDTSSSSPVCEVMQKVINVTIPLLNFNQAHIQTLMSSCSGQFVDHHDDIIMGSSSMSSSGDSTFVEVDHVHESLSNHLSKLGYKMIDKPLDVAFGVPQEGYMTLWFKLLGQDLRTEDALLKVVVRIYDLKNKEDSSSYHYSFDDRPVSLVSTSTPLQEVSLLSELSKAPHPNITSLIASFRAFTSEQHELFAQQMNPENPKKIYTTAPVADCIILEQPKIQLCEFFESQRRSRKCFRSYDVIPESTVLSLLSQLLLAVSHLVKNQIAHCAIMSSNVHVDQDNSNSIQLCNFSQAVQLNSKKLGLERIRLTQARLKSEVCCDMSNRHCVLAPEVVEAVENSELEMAFIRGSYKNIFAKNDTYGAALMVYNCFLNKSHSFLNRNQRKPYEYHEIPDLSEFSPQCNHLLKKLVAYDHKERLTPMEGAIACFVLIFGPVISDMKNEDQCYKWLLAETVEFYMRPVLVDSKMRDYTDSFSKLLCMYLAVASSNPRKVWEACRFFSSCVA